jgi:hypothetical protein
VQQAVSAVNGTAAAAGLPAAAAPPPLGRMDQSFLLFYGVSVCYYCCGVVLGWVLDPRFHGVSSAKFRLLGFWLRACTSFFLKKKSVLIWWASRISSFWSGGVNVHWDPSLFQV